MQTHPRFLAWYALIFFLLLTVLAGLLLVGQQPTVSSGAGSSNLPAINLDNLFGIN